jgi:hypothetical protein
VPVLRERWRLFRQPRRPAGSARSEVAVRLRHSGHTHPFRKRQPRSRAAPSVSAIKAKGEQPPGPPRIQTLQATKPDSADMDNAYPAPRSPIHRIVHKLPAVVRSLAGNIHPWTACPFPATSPRLLGRKSHLSSYGTFGPVGQPWVTVQCHCGVGEPLQRATSLSLNGGVVSHSAQWKGVWKDRKGKKHVVEACREACAAGLHSPG